MNIKYIGNYFEIFFFKMNMVIYRISKFLNLNINDKYFI